MSPVKIFILLQWIPVIMSAFQRKIVGGNVAGRGDFPHQVALRYNGKFLCGGSIINSFLVLTAAHCVESSDWPNVFDFEVIAGLHNETALNGKEQTRFIKHIYAHEEYNNDTLENDIAIVVLSESLQFTPYIWKIDLPEENEEFDGYATVSGWGTTQEYLVGYSEILKKLVAPIVPIQICRENYQSKGYVISDSVLCIGEFGQDTCKGDSGSAAICERMDSSVVQCGIVSTGRGCGRDKFPGIYTKVSSYVNWINNYEKRILADEKNEHLVIREIIKGNITHAIDTFKSFNASLLIRGIISGSYEKREDLQNFRNTLEFIKQLPNCELQEMAFSVLHEVWVRQNETDVSLKVLLFDESLNQCMKLTHLKNSMHKSAISIIMKWISIVPQGKDTKAITDFAYLNENAFSTFLHDIIIGTYTSLSHISSQDAIRNIIDFISELPDNMQHKIAFPVLWKAVSNPNITKNVIKGITACVSETDLDRELRKNLVKTWVFAVVNGENISDIKDFARECDTAFEEIVSDIVIDAYSKVTNKASREEIEFNIIDFITQLPWCTQYRAAVKAFSSRTKHSENGQNRYLLRIARVNTICNVANNTILAKEIETSALKCLKTWVDRVRHGGNITEIKQFAKDYDKDFSFFLEQLVVDAYGNVTNLNKEEIEFNIIDFITQLPWCTQYKPALEFVWNKIKTTGIPQNRYLLRIQRVNTICNVPNNTILAKEIETNALKFLKTWVDRVRHGGNITEIKQFAKDYDKDFSFFLDQLVVDAYGNMTNLNREEIEFNIIDFITQLPWCVQYRTALKAVWNEMKTSGNPQSRHLLRIARVNKVCDVLNDTTLGKEVEKSALLFLQTWVFEIRQGSNVSAIKEFAKEYDKDFSFFLEHIVRGAYNTGKNVNDDKIVIKILDFIQKLPYCTQDSTALPALWKAIKENGGPHKTYLTEFSNETKACMNESDLFKEVQQMVRSPVEA